MKKKLFIVIGIVVFIAIIVVLNLAREETGERVEAMIARKDNIVSKVRAEGTLKALNQVKIGSDVMGRIIELRVKEGDQVHKGDTLCIIDQSTYISRLKRAKASYKLAVAKLLKAEEDLKRSTELFNNKFISSEKYEQVKLTYEIAKAEKDAAMQTLNETQEMLNKTVITSPVDGEVVQLNKEVGEMAIVGTVGVPGSVIMTLALRSKMYVKALVDETELVKIEVGQPATVHIDAFPDTVFYGEVTQIGRIPEAKGLGTEEAINFPIEVEIKGKLEKLYPGMSATCEITIGKSDSVVVVPYSALGKKKIKDKEQDVVFVANGGKAKLTPVKLGLVGEKGVEIEQGVSAGDTILVGPYKVLRKLKDGEPIRVELKEEL